MVMGAGDVVETKGKGNYRAIEIENNGGGGEPWDVT